jgi:N-hydroxyarylamine O-acetyltransferase
MTVFDVDRYLARIGCARRDDPTLAALTELQVAHLVHVPFENLHVFHRVGVDTSVDWCYTKIVDHRRGGWCFELNGCFSELLRHLGYSVDLLSCRTFEAATGD